MIAFYPKVKAKSLKLCHQESVKHLLICMFRKLFKNIFPFSEIIFLLLQAYSLILL